MTRHRAFTLLEAVAVVAILTVIAGIGVWSLRGVSRMRGATDVARDLALLDAWSRRTAQGRFVAVRVAPDGAVGTDANGAVVREVRVPVEVTLVRVAVGEASADDEIVYSPSGRCESYAVEIQETPDRRVWLLVCGLTGAVREATDERTAEVWTGRFRLTWHELD